MTSNIVQFPAQNNWLLKHPSMCPVITDVMLPVIGALDAWFEKHSHKAYVTSGLRDPLDQLHLIQKYSRLHAVDIEFPNIMSCDLLVKANIPPFGLIYPWAPAWSRLLTMEIMVSPPADAACLFDYIHPKLGPIKSGTLRKASEHSCLTDVHPFDIGGGTGLKEAEIIITEAVSSKTIPAIIDFLIEVQNDALHVRCAKTIIP